MIVTEFVPNGSLGDNLPFANNSKLSLLAGCIRPTMIVAEMVLAMQCLHSRSIIQGDLRQANVLIDWDWIIGIGCFGHSLLADEQCPAMPQAVDGFWLFSVNARSTAPESVENEATLKSDVFSFGMILSELLSGKPGFSLDFREQHVMNKVILDHARPTIPSVVRWSSPPDLQLFGTHRQQTAIV
jgi:serine/threonine protein kinase